MPKLPDFTSLGQSPVPTPSTRVPRAYDLEAQKDAAQATRELGAAFEGVAQTIERVQDRTDKYVAEDAYNKLLEKKMDQTFGEDGFTKKKGESAYKGDLIKDYGDRFEGAVNDVSSGLTNPRQQKYFNDRASIARLQHKQDMLRHVTQETDVYMKDVYASTIKTETQNASVRWDSPNAVNTSATRINAAISQEGDRLGWPKEKIKQVQFEAASNMHIGVIQSAVSEKSPEYARSWFTVNKKSIDPDKYQAIENLIKHADLTEKVQSVVGDIANRGLEENEALIEVRKKFKGEEESEINKGVKAYFQETQAAADDRAWEIYAEFKGKPSERLQAVKNDALVWGRMSGRTKSMLKDKVEAGDESSIKPGDGAFYELRKMMRDDPIGFKEADLNQYALSPGDRKQLIIEQTDQDEFDSAATKDQIIKQGVASLGFDPKKATETGSTGDKVRAMYKRMDDEIKLESIAKGGRKLSPSEVEAIVDRMTIKAVREKAWGWVPFTGGEEAVGAMELIEGLPETTMDRGREVPTVTLYDELARNLRELGKPVTEENLAKAYWHYFGENNGR